MVAVVDWPQVLKRNFEAAQYKISCNDVRIETKQRAAWLPCTLCAGSLALLEVTVDYYTRLRCCVTSYALGQIIICTVGRYLNL
jgi:hypothetical protein